MAQKQRKQIENKPSILLSPEENQQIFRLVGSRCKVCTNNKISCSNFYIILLALDYNNSSSTAVPYPIT